MIAPQVYESIVSNIAHAELLATSIVRCAIRYGIVSSGSLMEIFCAISCVAQRSEPPTDRGSPSRPVSCVLGNNRPPLGFVESEAGARKRGCNDSSHSTSTSISRVVMGFLTRRR